jgi:hypothetical protein
MMAKSEDGDLNFKEYFSNVDPLCFWIEGIDCDEDVVLEVINHLNFYMSYYDTASPTINVHSPASENITQQPQTKYAIDVFPAMIAAVPITNTLLQLWQASRSGDPARRFLYCYQIIEYSSFYFLEDNVGRALRRLLSAPHAIANIEDLTSQIVDVLQDSKMDDHVKFEQLLGKTVGYKRLWREIELNISVFSNDMVFYGGFTAMSLAKNGWKLEDFEKVWKTSFPAAIRRIRNALSHAKEQRMTSVILPTADNLRRLQCWVPLVDLCAREVMVYRNLN